MSSVKMLDLNRLCLALILVVCVWCEEHTHHGPSSSHSVEGQHNAEYDHQAVLGSEEMNEEFDGLAPEEAKARLKGMVEKHDLDSDGFISKKEMDKWISNSFLSLDHEEMLERFEEEDEDKDELVSWQEYMNKVHSFNSEDVEGMRIQVGAAGEKSDEVREIESSLKILDEDFIFFKTADISGDGNLSQDEYMAFYFPHNYKHMHHLEVDRYLSQNDADKDGKISLLEFMPEGASTETRISTEENFADYDKDKDGLLTGEEVKEYVAPETDDMAEEEATHLMSMADEDLDGQLSMKEILDKTDQFVGSSATDYGNLLRHEEL